MVISPTEIPTPVVTRRRISHTKLKVVCGCGASFPVLEEGEKHAETTGHTLHILGEIRPQSA